MLINFNDLISMVVLIWGFVFKFCLVNLMLGLQFDGVLFVFVGIMLDLIYNIGFDLKDIEVCVGVLLVDLCEKINVVQVCIQVGMIQFVWCGDWQVFVVWCFVQCDVWVDGFIDMIWYFGGINYKGWSFGGNVGLDKNFWLGVCWISMCNFDDGVCFLVVFGDLVLLSGNFSSVLLKIDVFQFDLNVRF